MTSSTAFLLLLSLLVGATAFKKVVTPPVKSSPTALRLISVGRDDLPGVFGGTVFDPLSLSDGLNSRDLKLWREAELKHGRVAMLASLGYLVQESFHPLFGMQNMLMSAPIYHFQQVQGVPFFVISLIAGIGAIEMSSVLKYWYTDTDVGRSYQKDDTLPGDLSWDPLGFSPDRKEKVKSTYNKVNPEMKVMQSKELNNGRTAMIGVAGMTAQMLVDHRGIMEHFNEFGLNAAGPLLGAPPL